MTILKNPSGDGFILKTKNSQVNITRSKIEIGDFKISGPGEYDLSDVSCDVQSLDGHINSLIESEMILLGALDAKVDIEDLSEDFTKVSVLLLFIDNVNDIKLASSLVSKVEPQLVFYLSQEKIDSKVESSIETIPSPFKISKNELVYEGTRHLVFE